MLPIASQRLLSNPGWLLSGWVVGFPMIHRECVTLSLKGSSSQEGAERGSLWNDSLVCDDGNL